MLKTAVYCDICENQMKVSENKRGREVKVKAGSKKLGKLIDVCHDCKRKAINFYLAHLNGLKEKIVKTAGGQLDLPKAGPEAQEGDK